MVRRRRIRKPSPNAAVDKAGRLLRQLLPFPSSADASSLLTPLMPVRRNLSPQSMLSGEIPPAAGQQAASIVSEAASILDEEMAKGVLAARGANQFPGYRDADPSSAVLRQVHDVIDNIARIWPSIQGASTQWPGASVATREQRRRGSAAEPEARVRASARPARHHLHDALQQGGPIGPIDADIDGSDQQHGWTNFFPTVRVRA